MKTADYKRIKKEAEQYINNGKPLAALHVMEQWELELSFKQYYELADMIHTAVEGGHK